jgi:prepilin-type N-terminal cleavage/methylation domain-containing protein
MSPIFRRGSSAVSGLRCPGGQTGDASLAGESDDGACSYNESLAHPNRLPANGRSSEKIGGPTCGFSLTEVLVALAVAAMMAAILTRYVAGTSFNVAQVRERLEVWTLSQSMLDGLSKTLSPGTSSGQIGTYRWNREIAPITPRVVALTEAPSAQGVLGGRPSAAPNIAWALYRVKVQIEAPSGRQYATDTIRITQLQAQETSPHLVSGSRE